MQANLCQWSQIFEQRSWQKHTDKSARIKSCRLCYMYKNIFEIIEYFNVCDHSILSDHCLIDLTLSFTCADITRISTNYSFEKVMVRYVWKTEKSEIFQERLFSQST